MLNLTLVLRKIVNYYLVINISLNPQSKAASSSNHPFYKKIVIITNLEKMLQGLKI